MDVGAMTLSEITNLANIILVIVAVVKLYKSPNEELKKDYTGKFESLDEKIIKLEEKINNDDSRINEVKKQMRDIEDTQYITLKSIKVLIDHNVDDNHTGELIAMQDELDGYLLKKVKGD